MLHSNSSTWLPNLLQQRQLSRRRKKEKEHWLPGLMIFSKGCNWARGLATRPLHATAQLLALKRAPHVASGAQQVPLCDSRTGAEAPRTKFQRPQTQPSETIRNHPKPSETSGFIGFRNPFRVSRADSFAAGGHGGIRAASLGSEPGHTKRA